MEKHLSSRMVPIAGGLLLTLLLVLTACAPPAGPTGVSGPQGASGTAGPPGPPGHVGPAATPSLLRLIVEPVSGVAGKTPLTISGSGFVPGEEVRVLLGLDGYDLSMAAANTGGIVVANKFGAIMFKPAGGIPGSDVIKPGAYTVKAIGNKGSMAVATLAVVGAK